MLLANKHRPLLATLITLFAFLLVASSWAATPSLTVATASGQAGTAISLPINFDPGSASITDMQFDLTLPAAISTVSVAAGSALTSAGINLGTAVLGGHTWRFLLTGSGSNAIGIGAPLLTAQVRIAAGTAAGSLSITASNVLFSDVNGHQVAAGTITGGAVTVLPSAPAITSAGTASGVLGSAITAYQITATNNPASFGASGLPPGLSVNTGTGLITGTPTSAGVFNGTISATNGAGAGSAALVFTITSTPPPVPVITSAGTGSGVVGTAIAAYQITATNNPASFGASGLPPGLSVNLANGLITGTPTSAGTFNGIISATNPGGTASAALVFTITAAPPSPPVITSAGTAAGVLNTVFSPYQILATNSPTSFGATGLPAGLTVNIFGSISGTPMVAGTFNATLSATNANGTGSAALIITISASPPPAPVITSAGTATGTVGTAITPYQITATNSPTNFGASGLPAGLSVSALGQISGTPSQSGTYNVTVNATNAGGTGNKIVVFTVSESGGTLPPPTLNLPAELSVRAQITVGYPSGYTIDHFNWSLNQPSAGASAATERMAAGSAGASFSTPNRVADLAPRNLEAGRYLVQVTATDDKGITSPPAQAFVNLVADDLGGIQVYPNPWKSDRHAHRPITFAGLPANTSLQIFSMAGRLVRSFGQASGSVDWDLANDSGDPVASGLYLYVINAGGQRSRGKLAVIR